MDREIHRDGIHVKHIAPDHWWQRAKWELLQDYTSWNGMVTVPKGFITDGATIIWLLRWRFSPTGKWFGAAIIHDYILCGTKTDWERANKEFENEMEAMKVSKFDMTVMVGAVKLFAWFKTKVLKRPPKCN